MPHEPATDASATLAEFAAVALLEVTSQNVILAANPAAQDLFGLSRRGLVGHRLDQVIVEAGELERLVARAINEQVDVAAANLPLKPLALAASQEVTARLRVSEGGRIVIALTSPLSWDSENGASGVASFGRILGHEIKNPLAGISGAAQLLLRSGHGQDEELISLIRDECARIERLVNRLSAFELFSAPCMEAMNVHEVLDQVVSAEAAAFDGAVAFQRRYDPSLPDIAGDSDHLHEAFQNIIRNAGEAAEANAAHHAASVEVVTAFETGVSRRSLDQDGPAQRALRISVTDTGAGIDPEDLPGLFQAFSTGKSGGRGLGLTIVKEVVNAHCGHLAIEPADPGTRVSVFLPIPREAG